MKDVYSLFLSKFGKFTEIQELSAPAIKAGKNCVITSPTGTGKTEAALLPVLEMLEKEKNGKGILAFYITPLRALNRDLSKRLEWLTSETGISLGTRHGDTTAKEREAQAANPPLLIITTPETMQNLFFSPRLREAMKKTKVVIIDELHELYYNKRGAQLSVALERLHELAGDFQRIGISATIGDMDELSSFLFGNRKFEVIKAKNAKKFEVTIEMPQAPNRKHEAFEEAFSIDDSALARIERVSDIINSSGATLVFANTRQVVESLGSKLVYLNRLEGLESVGIHHSSLEKQERIEIENSFKEGKLKGIVATSSLELGIDIGKIDHVVQYGSPRQAGRLIQRIGRGGHTVGGVSRGHIIVSGAVEALESAATVIAAENNELEKRKAESSALDVLINQVCAIALEYKKVSFRQLHSIIRRSYIYRNLDAEALKKILTFASDSHLVRFDGEFVSISIRTRKYFFGNISVIPDSPRFYVRDAVRNRIISTLDEGFVSSYLDVGVSFITKGLPWKVLSIEEDTVFVEAGTEYEAAVPDWDGEDIPVSYYIARSAASLFGRKEELEKRLDREAFARVSSFINAQSSSFLPKENKVVIEELDDYIVVYLSLGKLANEFLARVIAGLLTDSVKERVFVRATPYCIIIDCKYLRRMPDMQKLFGAMRNAEILDNPTFIENSELFRYKFVRVAKLFGIVEKKATLTKSMVNRLIEYYKGSPVFEETLRDLKKNYLDSEVMKDFLLRLRKGEVLFDFRNSESPLSKEILRSVLNYREFVSRATAGDEEIKAFEDRLRNKSVLLLCTYCGLEFSHNLSLESEEKIHCPRCKSTMLSTYKENYSEVLSKKLEGKKLMKGERDVLNEMMKETGMLSAYGDRAIMALLTYGVGIVTAARILKMVRKDRKYFVKDLINAQKTFVKNSKFWMNK